jgi:hypothetical protein
VKPLDVERLNWDAVLQGCAPCCLGLADELRPIIDLQTRALLAVEWGPRCPWCDERGVAYRRPRRHTDGCPIDAALTAAGLPDQASRDAARAEIAKAADVLAKAVSVVRAATEAAIGRACGMPEVAVIGFEAGVVHATVTLRPAVHPLARPGFEPGYDDAADEPAAEPERDPYT